MLRVTFEVPRATGANWMEKVVVSPGNNSTSAGWLVIVNGVPDAGERVTGDAPTKFMMPLPVFFRV